MAILRKSADACAPGVDPPGKDKVVDFTYTSDALAQLIVDIWVNKDVEKKLLKENIGERKKHAKELLASEGYFLANPVVISEKEYRDHFRQEADNEIVFVVPDHERTTQPVIGRSLLDTAKLLMAVTPNGI